MHGQSDDDELFDTSAWVSSGGKPAVKPMVHVSLSRTNSYASKLAKFISLGAHKTTNAALFVAEACHLLDVQASPLEHLVGETPARLPDGATQPWKYGALVNRHEPNKASVVLTRVSGASGCGKTSTTTCVPHTRVRV